MSYLIANHYTSQDTETDQHRQWPHYSLKSVHKWSENQKRPHYETALIYRASFNLKSLQKMRGGTETDGVRRVQTRADMWSKGYHRNWYQTEANVDTGLWTTFFYVLFSFVVTFVQLLTIPHLHHVLLRRRMTSSKINLTKGKKSKPLIFRKNAGNHLLVVTRWWPQGVHNPGDDDRLFHRCENIKSQTTPHF
jgi:hypothetical protein